MATGDSLTSLDGELAALEAALGAQYEILRPLGRGGMGAVYLARERLLERLVAIKVLHRVDADSHERFLREARAAARLTHPHIVPLHSFGQSGDTVFYVMGYVEGESLESLLRRNGRLPATDAARILAELADALDFAHRNGVVHRDVKPDNVLIEQGTGRAVLTDFGIARLESGVSLTQTGVIIGTPQYMSPEQAAGDKVIDGRSDLYSLGLIGYRMIAGRLPFEGATRELLAQHVTRRAPPIQSLVPDVPPGVGTAIMRCLEKEPAERWTSGSELRATLGAADSTALALPDGLEHHASLGIGISYGAAAIFGIGETIYGVTGETWGFQFGGVGAALVYAALLPALFEARRAGMSVRQSLRALFAAPAKYSTWWPRRLRRPGDVWDRLPAPVRRGRAIVAGANVASFVIASVGLPGFVSTLMRPEHKPHPWIVLGCSGAAIALIAVAVTASIIVTRWAKRHGIPRLQVRRWINEPAWGSSFWSRPDVAVLLEPARPGPLSDSPSTPAALAAAVLELAADLERLDAVLAAEVRASAQELGAVIRNFDRELGELAAHLDPNEASRLAERMESLGPARADEGDAARQMRRLMADQLALINDLSQRSAALDERRATAIERLRSLWMHLQGLRARRVLQDADAAEITARIRAACANVKHLNAAFDEVNALTNRPTATPAP